MSILDKWPLADATKTIRNGIREGFNAYAQSSRAVQSTSTDPALRNRDYAVIIQQDQELPVGDPKIIVGMMPESLQIEQSSEFDTPWGAGLGGDGMMGNLLALTGNRLVGQIMTMKVWQGAGNDFSFTVQFELRAWSDPWRDVGEPLQKLLSLTLPKQDSTGFLRSPGPILDAEGVKKISGNVTTLAVGGIKTVAQASSNLVSQQTIDGAAQALSDGQDKISKFVGSAGLLRKTQIEDHIKNKIHIQIGRWFSMRNVLVTSVQHDIKPQTPDRKSGLFQSASVVVTFTPMFALTEEDIGSLISNSGGSQFLASSSTKDPRYLARGSRGY